MVRWTLALLVLVGCAATERSEDVATTSSSVWPPATSPAGSISEPLTATGWKVLEVVDGDTLRVVGPDGEQRVRLIGVNAPEEDECFHDEATAVLRDVAGRAAVVLVRDASDRDRFDRLLRFVERTDGVDVGAELVRRGAARSQRYEPDVSRNDHYDELQAEARAAGRGLWASDACGTPATTGELRVGVDLQYDAPGDDNLNLNEEWVRFTNEGDAPLDLSGWLVADESSSHRYRFDELELAAGASVTLFTGCGRDTSTERYWCNDDSAVWNNSGDTVFLRDPQGNTVLAESYRE
jgi:endonuclease YncB( thermonuclease family)